MKLTGIIRSDGFVKTPDGKLFILPKRGTDDNGFPKVLIDAKSVGGGGSSISQSIKPLIGMKVKFITAPNYGVYGYNFIVIP